MTKPKRANMYEHQCRNGHRRTAENTYIRSGGARQCMDCPGWQRNQLSAGKRAKASADASRLEHHYHRVLSPAELDYLRGLIPCAGCAAPFGADHDTACPVPYNREDDGTAEPSAGKRAA